MCLRIYDSTCASFVPSNYVMYVRICNTSVFFISDDSGSENSLANRKILIFRNNSIQEILRTCQSYKSFITYLHGVWILSNYFIWCGGMEVSIYCNFIFYFFTSGVSPYCVTCRIYFRERVHKSWMPRHCSNQILYGGM